MNDHLSAQTAALTKVSPSLALPRLVAAGRIGIISMLACAGLWISAGSPGEAVAAEGGRNIETNGEKVVLFLGDSLTAGYGLPPEQAYPSLLERKAKKEGINARFVNAGVSGDTTAGGVRRLDWLLKQKIDVMVLALGANDGLRGVPVTETEANLRTIVKRVREKSPGATIVLAGMLMPPNMGADYTTRFREVFRRVASDMRLTLIPFLLEGVAGEAHLNLPDGVHPNAEGYKIVAERVWPLLRRELTGSSDAHQ